MKFIRRIIGKIMHIILIFAAKFFFTEGQVLMLHWVGNEVQDDETEPYRISIVQFERLVQWLQNRKTIRLEKWENEHDFYAITIDDVPENFYLHAYPILKRAGLPFTIFVNISLLNQEGFITTEQLIEMSQCELCTIGSHGISHGEFAVLNREQVEYELKNSKLILESIVNKPVELFAFPYGSYYACGYSNKHLAGEIYEYAFGTVASSITKPSLLKKYFLPRINVDVNLLNSML